MVRERTKNRDFQDILIIPAATAKPGLNISSQFPAPGPLEVDIGCGRGRFIQARALGHPNVNFLGIDRVSLRLRKIDRRATQAGITNIRLIQGNAIQVIKEILPPCSVSVFYIFYPDPWPKRRHHCHRLVSPSFINLLHITLVEAGEIHLCTDHDDYFLAIRRLFTADSRFIEIPHFLPSAEEETDFGLLFTSQNRLAKRCSFRKQSG
jgi:tRNA (guanine-N7-)-methyltransferase